MSIVTVTRPEQGIIKAYLEGRTEGRRAVGQYLSDGIDRIA